MKKNSQKFGRDSEQLAAEYLIAKGISILERNWRFKRYEVDLIGETEDLIVFCEVKARTSINIGDPEDFVDLRKQGFLMEAANNYIQMNSIEKEARFDIIAITKINNNTTVKHLPGAFYPSVK